MLLLLGSVWQAGSAADVLPPVSAMATHEAPLGRSISYFSEGSKPLSLNEAITAYDRGAFTASDYAVLSFGIGSSPIWLHFRVDNATAHPLLRRLSVETAWLDQVDVYFRYQGQTAAVYHMGDRQVFSQRPINSRFFALDYHFEPGVSDLFIRVATPDPMVLPIYLMTQDQADQQAETQNGSYGFLYGFLFALLAYNAMLYAGLRQTRYLLYALYLGMFLLMNISYTGHGFRWLWPEHTIWAQWSNPVLMIFCAASGLLFGLSFLETRTHFPRARKAVLAFIGGVGLLLLLAIWWGDQRDALLLAFSFVCAFAAIMLILGVMSVRAKIKGAKYFLLAAFSAMVGAVLTALAVWGVIPFTTWTYRAVDLGLMLDATLLALALTYQFRIGQTEKLHAEQQARIDPLTEINNRRAFYDIALPIWRIAARHQRHLSVIMLDIDFFKQINDTYGHVRGDEALVALADVLKNAARTHDLVARWGGEEFILLLSETDLSEAMALAERLRVAIEAISLVGGRGIHLTASFGVVQRDPEHHNLDQLISAADAYLYQAKALGRNRVCHP